MKAFNSKKAVSPLVATFLLVGFALIMGVVVMAVGGDYLSLEEESEEEPASVDLINIVDTCKEKGAITADEHSALKEKLS